MEIDLLLRKQLDLFEASVKWEKEEHSAPSLEAQYEKLLEPMQIDSLLKKTGKKKPISKALRMAVWQEYIGIQEAYCYCCQRQKINPFRFQCGHNVAESKGGETSLENLRPVCDLCNQSMGTKNLEEFKQTLCINRERSA
jgi:hypothetical protein